MVGLQAATEPRVVNIVWILGGAYFAVSGQIDIAIMGFAYQLVSQFCHCSMLVISDWMMKSQLEVDALTCTMFLTTASFAFLLMGSCEFLDQPACHRLSCVVAQLDREWMRRFRSLRSALFSLSYSLHWSGTRPSCSSVLRGSARRLCCSST